VQQSLPLFAGHLGIGIAEDEPNGGKEIALARTIATDDNIRAGREGFDDGLILVAMRKSARVAS
jgi:hypothetical protein